MGKSNKNEPTELEKKIQFSRQYTKLWADLFAYFSDKIEEGSITAQREEEFFKIMSVLANRHFELVTRLDGLKEPNKIIDFLGKLVCLANMQVMSEVEFSSCQVQWHEIFIGLNKALGKLIQQLPMPATEAKPQPATVTA